MTHYKILGVSKAATPEEIKLAHRKLAMQNHPDLQGMDSKKADAMADFNVAYNVLKDPKRRKEYDKQLLLHNKPCSKCKGAGVTMKQKGFSKKIAEVCTACDGGGIVEK